MFRIASLGTYYSLGSTSASNFIGFFINFELYISLPNYTYDTFSANSAVFLRSFNGSVLTFR